MPADPRARAAVALAVAAGVLPPVATEPCADCGARARFRHHEQGYAPEHWLAVVPLCGRCHSRRHIAQGTRKSRSTRPSDLFSVRCATTSREKWVAAAQAERRTLNNAVNLAMDEWAERVLEAQRLKTDGADGR